MSHQRKTDIETRKVQAERKLAARLEVLKARGLEETRIQKDATIRQIKAAIRHARRQMERIAEFEDLDRQKAERREEKHKAPKELKPKVKKAQQGESRRKAKREKKQSLQGQAQEDKTE